jgi:hypothetical protein
MPKTNTTTTAKKQSRKDYIKFDEFNIDNVVIQPMKQYASGAKYFPIGYALTEEDKIAGKLVPLNLLSADAMLHWGIKKFDAEDDWTLDIPLVENVPEAFRNMFLQIDEKVKAFAFENSVSFFGKEKSKEVVDEFFSPTLKGVKDKRNGGIINKYKVSFKVPMYKGEYKILICDANKKPVFPTERTSAEGETPDMYVPPKSTIRFIFNISSIWLSNGRYGYSKKFQQGIVSEPQQSMLSGCIINDSDDDKEEGAEDEDEDDDDENDFGVRLGDVVADDGEYNSYKAAGSTR